jgi:hypothetical protein
LKDCLYTRENFPHTFHLTVLEFKKNGGERKKIRQLNIMCCAAIISKWQMPKIIIIIIINFVQAYFLHV